MIRIKRKSQSVTLVPIALPLLVLNQYSLTSLTSYNSILTDKDICLVIYAKITEVNLSILVYRLFHKDFSPIIGTNFR